MRLPSASPTRLALVGASGLALATLAGCARLEEASTQTTVDRTCASAPATTAPSSCAPSVPAAGAHTGQVLISWSANREKAVNSSGGGYRIEYSTSASFPAASTTTVDVPYVSGATAPTSYTLTGVSAGNYCVRVTAYSSLNPTGTSSYTTVGVP